MEIVGRFFKGMELTPPEGYSGKEIVVTWATLKKVYGWSLVLTAVVALFAFEPMSSAFTGVGNSIGWFVFLLVPHLLA